MKLDFLITLFTIVTNSLGFAAASSYGWRYENQPPYLNVFLFGLTAFLNTLLLILMMEAYLPLHL